MRGFENTAPQRGCALLVEDEDIVAQPVILFLQAFGFSTVHHAPTLADAEAFLATTRPDFALLDVSLGNGETTAPLLPRLGDVPFLVASGFSMDELPDAFAGVPFVSKPLTLASLGAAIERHEKGASRRPAPNS